MAEYSGTERMTDGFWQDHRDNLNASNFGWYRDYVNRQDNRDYSNEGELGHPEVERVIGAKRWIGGQEIDQYLRQVGRGIENKLSRSKATGEIEATSLFVTTMAMSGIEAICVGCGVQDVKRIKGKAKNDPLKKMRFFIDTEEVASKVFGPSRFDGTNYLAKRFFCKKSSAEMEYNGLARVVVTQQTPIIFEYKYSNNILSVTCSVQRYNADGTCVDSTLQEKINSS